MNAEVIAMPTMCYELKHGMEPGPGALWWTNVAGNRILHSCLPNGGVFSIISDPRTCEVIGELPIVTIVKRDSDPFHECSISGTCGGMRFHGFLWHGDLINIELLAKSRQEWLALSPNDQQSVIDKVAPETIPWPVSSKQL